MLPKDPLEHLTGEIEMAVNALHRQTERIIHPYRETVFRRFPVLFTLLVTFGIVSVFFGLERIIAEITWLNTRPWLILGVGLLILTLTGTLYKKLGHYEDS